MTETTEKKLRKFVNMADDVELSPIARAMITQYLDLSPADFQTLYQSIPNGIEFVKQRGMIPPQQADPLINYMRANPQCEQALRNQLFLFSAGSQLAFAAMTPEQKASLRDSKTLRTLYEDKVFRPIGKGLDPLYAYADENDQSNPNAVLVTLGGAIAYAVSYINGTGAQAQQRLKEQYSNQIREALHAGAEETLHALQHHDPQKRAALEADAILRYGPDWQNERERQFIASRVSPEAIKAFASKDPWEKDADAMLATLENRLNALAGKFQSPQMGI